MKLTKLVNDYYSSYDYRNLRDETKAQYKYQLSVMLETEVEGKPLCHYDYTTLSTRVAKMSYNQWCEKGLSMANHLLSATRIVFNHGLREELCVINPFSNVRKRPTERRKVVWGREDVQKFLGTAYSDFSTRNVGLIAHMAYEWCQRLGDMRLLTWDAIDFEAQTVFIEQSKRKAAFRSMSHLDHSLVLGYLYHTVYINCLYMVVRLWIKLDYQESYDCLTYEERVQLKW